MAVRNGVYRCRKLNYDIISKNNTKRLFTPPHNSYEMKCLERLVKIELVEPLVIENEGYVKPFKSFIICFIWFVMYDQPI